MKITLNAIKQFTDVDLPIEELVGKIGSQLGEVEHVEALGEKYRGVVVARVVSCEDHPNADRLHVCTIDDGGKTPDVTRNEDGHVQVVCGAPNVREGLMVAWLPPGSTVPESVGKEPFVLEARELRGVVSNGMLASQRELALGDNHEGILEIDQPAEPGQAFADVYLLDDYVIEIENKMFTHRPDCFGILGVAREIAGITGKQFIRPDWYQPSPGVIDASADLRLEITNELPELVPRFSAITMSDVSLRPSPVWLQVFLAKLGQKSINNVVDLTNFYMLVTGQPLHAYDYDKVRALSGGDTAKLVVRYPHAGEKIKLLNGKEIEPRAEAIMIATDRKAIGIGGVMGGAETEIDENTKNIILEAATFDMYSIRRTSMAHGLFTDAVTRFNKGQSPLQTLAVLAQIVADVVDLAEAKVASRLIDINSADGREWVHPPVTVTTAFVNERLGSSLGAEDMKTLLTNVEFAVEIESDSLRVTAPFWRTDIELREDVVEEIGRLYGYDRLPLELPKRSIRPVAKDESFEKKAALRHILSRDGANETLTYSFVHGNLLDKVGQDTEESFRLSNALSPDLQYYRLSLTPSLLEKIHTNIKAGYDDFALFELGKVHGRSEVDEAGLPNEFDRLALVVAADAKSSGRSGTGAAFYRARLYAEEVIENLSLKLRPLKDTAPESNRLTVQMLAPYEPGRSAAIVDDDRIVGVIGEFKRSVTKSLKLPEYCGGFEVFMSATQPRNVGYQPLSRFPSVTQDITLRTPSAKSYREVEAALAEAILAAKPDGTTVSVEPLGIYQQSTDDPRNISLRIVVVHHSRTLTDNEVSQLLDHAAATLRQQLGVERV